MPEIQDHAPGSFCWFELATSDQAAAKNFYTSLFGWTVEDFPMGPNGSYSIFRLRGRDTGAAYTIHPQQRSLGVPPNWGVYIAVEKADESAKRAADLGANVLAPAFDVMDMGRMAVLADPAGAVFMVWEKKRHAGTGIAAEDGTVCWADLMTRDIPVAERFYSGLFGWQMTRSEHDSSGYLHIKNGDEFIGGIPPMGPPNPNAPAHWLIYFQVANCDASAEKAKVAGAEMLAAPMTIERVGRIAMVRDPQGAVFSLFEPERK